MNFTKPIEMPRGLHYGSNFYQVFSSKLNRTVTLYSNLEYYNFLLLEIDSNVISFCEQPLKIDIIQGGIIKHAIFDFWVKYKDGSEEFQEVKYFSEITGDGENSIRSREQIKRMESWCRDNNVKFTLKTEKEIIKGPFHMSNLNVIIPRVKRYFASEGLYYDPQIICALDELGPMTIKELIAKKLLPNGNEINHICHLYSRGVIDMNIYSSLFDYNTEVRLCQS